MVLRLQELVLSGKWQFYIFPPWNVGNYKTLILTLLINSSASGVECMITANTPTLQGDAWNAMTMARGQRISEIAWINRLPHIQLVQSVSAGDCIILD